MSFVVTATVHTFKYLHLHIISYEVVFGEVYDNFIFVFIFVEDKNPGILWAIRGKVILKSFARHTVVRTLGMIERPIILDCCGLRCRTQGETDERGKSPRLQH